MPIRAGDGDAADWCASSWLMNLTTPEACGNSGAAPVTALTLCSGVAPERLQGSEHGEGRGLGAQHARPETHRFEAAAQGVGIFHG